MKKKFVLIMALLAALALVITGCPGEGDPEEGPPEDPSDPIGLNLTEIFSATETSQAKATVTVTASSATFSIATETEMWGELVTPEEARWDASEYTGIKFQYQSTGFATIFIQDTNSIYIFGYDGGDGWGAIYPADGYWEDLTIPFSALIRQDWFGENKPFIKSEIIKLCFQVNDGDAPRTFKIQNFEIY